MSFSEPWRKIFEGALTQPDYGFGVFPLLDLEILENILASQSQVLKHVVDVLEVFGTK